MSQAGLRAINEHRQSVDAYVLCDEGICNLTHQEVGTLPSVSTSTIKSFDLIVFQGLFLAGIRLGWLATHDQAVMKACLSYHHQHETISCGQLDKMVVP